MSLAKYLSCHWWVYKSHSQVLCPAVYLHDLFKTLNSSGCLLICLLFESFFQLYLKWNHIYVIIFFLWFSIWEKHSSERKQTNKKKKTGWIARDDCPVTCQRKIQFQVYLSPGSTLGHAANLGHSEDQNLPSCQGKFFRHLCIPLNDLPHFAWQGTQ